MKGRVHEPEKPVCSDRLKPVEAKTWHVRLQKIRSTIWIALTLTYKNHNPLIVLTV